MQTKIVISPTNKKAINFFDELGKKKAQIKKEIEKSALVLKIQQKLKK